MEVKFFKCTVCGKVIAMLKETASETICCGKSMVQLVAGTTDAAVEKHVPVVTVDGSKVEVTVGSVIHPMEEKHFIEWIALETNQGVQIKFLKAGQEPKCCFALSDGEIVVKAYAYCNIHGLWASK